MRLVDANVLLYAVNSDAPHHERSRRWLDDALSGSETVGFAWIVLVAFIRLSTKTELFDNPLTVDEAMDYVDAWLGSSAAVIVAPTPTHSSTLRRLLADIGTGGNLTNDAHLAALALEHRCRVVSFDGDFAKFAGIESGPPPAIDHESR